MPTAEATLFYCKSGEAARTRDRTAPVGGAKRCGLAAVLLCAPLLAYLAPAAAAAALPTITISGGPPVTEGTAASFTVTATPAPASDLSVRLRVKDAAHSDFVASRDEGNRRVTIPGGGTGSTTVTVATVADDTDEPNGKVKLSVRADNAYAGRPSASVRVKDDDDPPKSCLSDQLGSQAWSNALFGMFGTPTASHAKALYRALVTFRQHDIVNPNHHALPVWPARHGTQPTGTITAQEVKTVRGGDPWTGWNPIIDALEKLETCRGVRQQPDPQPDPPASAPEVSIAAGARVTEGGAATFTLTATPVPSAALTVEVTVTQAGGYATAGTRQVSIPAGGTATLGIATTDDDVDEADGSVTATLVSGTGYTVAAPPRDAATVVVADDDDPPVDNGASCVSASLLADVEGRIQKNNAARWTRVKNALTQRPKAITLAEAKEFHDRRAKNGRSTAQWTPVITALECLEAASESTPVPVPDTVPAPVPELSLSAGSAVDEGGNAVFTITADSAPAADLTVAFTVAQSGEVLDAPGAGQRTVTLAAGAASVTLSVATVDDDANESDGSVSVILEAGTGYTVGSAYRQSVSVADDDPCVSSILATQAWNNARNGIINATDIYQARALRRALVTFRQHGMVNLRLPPWPHGWLPTGTITAQEVKTVRGGDPWTGWTPVIEALEGLEACHAAGKQPVSPAPDDPCVSSSLVSQAWNDARTGINNTSNASHAKALYRTLVTLRQHGASRSLPSWPARHGAQPTGTITAKEVWTVRGGRGIWADRWAGWNSVIEVLEGLETCLTSRSPPPEVSIAAGAGVTEGNPASFTITANPVPAAPLTVALTVRQSGDFAVSGATGSKTVTIPISGSATLSVATMDDAAHEPAGGSVTATLAAGTGYWVAEAPGDAATVAVADDDPVPTGPTLSIADAVFNEDEPGAHFTVTLSEPLERAVMFRYATNDLTPPSAEAGRDYQAAPRASRMLGLVRAGQTKAQIPVTIHEDTLEEDPEIFEMVLFDVDENPPHGAVPVTIADGVAVGTITRGDPNAAGIPTLRVYDAEAQESERYLTFWIRLSRPMNRRVYFSYYTRQSTPVSAQPGVDYYPSAGPYYIPPGSTEGRLLIDIVNDSHDEGPETFEFVIGSYDSGVRATRTVAVGTILNSDPMPAAWLARFGRTVAEQALDGISGRMAAPRTAGVEGTLAGQALSFGAAGEAANDTAAPGGFSGAGPGTGPGRLPAWSELGTADRFGDDAWGLGESRAMTAHELLLGSHFTATGETDAAGGSLAFWGRAAQSTFDGREGAFSLDGETTSGMLGADYARGNWLAGFALMQSSGEGGYADNGAGPQRCPDDGDGMAPDTEAFLCGGAVREGDGTVEASLTAAIPYAAIQASERLKLWGALGYGAGEVTLEPAMGESLDSDISWTMAAAGARSDLLPPPAEGSGPALALISDAFWARTSSEKTPRLAASDSDATRLRLGLEGSWRIATEGGGHLTPKLEIGARHDGGDAETGFGMEFGGGLAWSDPALGMSLDLSGRTLIAHGSDDLEDRGFAASLVFDPDPASRRGLSLTLTQDWGGAAQGGLDALFAPDPLDRRSGGDETTARWTAEAAYGFPAFGGRFTGSPHVGLGLATATRDYTLGWRLAPAANANAPDLSFGVQATRRESETAQPEHSAGFEAAFRW